MNRRFGLSLVMLAVALPGCFPEKRVVWSPDGRFAAVVGSDGLYLCGPDGQLSPRVVEGAARVAWMPDSRGLLVVRNHKISAWQDTLPFITDAQRARIVEAAERVHDQVLAFSGTAGEFAPRGLDEYTDGEKAAILVYLRSLNDPRMAEKLGDDWSKLETATVDGWSLQGVDVVDGRGTPGTVLVRTADEMCELRVASHRRAVAYVAAGPKHDEAGAARLFVAPLDGRAAPRLVAEHVALFPDWSADGRALVYVHANAAVPEKDVTLGAVARRFVADADGGMLESFPDAEDLAGLLYQDETRVRCLKDGRILFSAVEVHLPATTGDMPQRGALFFIDPGRQAVISRVLTRAAEAEIADRIFLFELSPDEAHVCIPGGKGEVSLVTLATSQVWTPVGRQEHGSQAPNPPLSPAWRSADELVCPVSETDGRWQVALYKWNWEKREFDKKDLSANWPAEAAQFLSEDQKQ